MFPYSLLVATCLFALGGCVSHNSVNTLAGPAVQSGVTAVGQIETTSHTGKLLAVLEPYVKADIASVVLTLATQALPTTTVATVTVPAASLNSPVSFANLKHLTAYQVTAQAYLGGGTQIDNLAIAPATCTTLFATTTDVNVAVGVLKLRLRDKAYVGTTNTTTVGVVDGAIVDAEATTTIIIGN